MFININVYIWLALALHTHTYIFDTLNWAWHCLKYNLIISLLCGSDTTIYCDISLCVCICLKLFVIRFRVYFSPIQFWKFVCHFTRINHIIIDWSSLEVCSTMLKNPFLPQNLELYIAIVRYIDRFAQFYGKSICDNPKNSIFVNCNRYVIGTHQNFIFNGFD